MALHLDYAPQNTTTSSDITTSWNPICHITYTCDTWVKLLQVPSEYAADEAKLLCQASENSWVVWIPGHGEEMLNRSDFYC